MSPNANTSTNANTSGSVRLDLVRRVRPPGGEARDAGLGIRQRADGLGTISSRRTARDAFETASALLALDRHGDVRDRRVLIDVHRDRLVHAAARERTLLEPPDRRLHGGRVHVGRLDDHVGRKRRAREGLLHAVVGLHRRQGLRERVRAGLAMRSWSAGIARATSSPPARTADSAGPTQDAVDDRAPDPALAVVAPEPADERHAHPVDVVAEPARAAPAARSASRASQSRRRRSSRSRTRRRSGRRSGTCRPSPS